uniref:Transmembrane protein n=1 Tax=Arabidopsis thaliana TaxID=3702 RepID=Q1PE73_ARATH|nr:hypothetical protein At4g18090 [Arabidopsis thaliana]
MKSSYRKIDSGRSTLCSLFSFFQITTPKTSSSFPMTTLVPVSSSLTPNSFVHRLYSPVSPARISIGIKNINSATRNESSTPNLTAFLLLFIRSSSRSVKFSIKYIRLLYPKQLRLVTPESCSVLSIFTTIGVINFFFSFISLVSSFSASATPVSSTSGSPLEIQEEISFSSFSAFSLNLSLIISSSNPPNT